MYVVVEINHVSLYQVLGMIYFRWHMRCPRRRKTMASMSVLPVSPPPFLLHLGISNVRKPFLRGTRCLVGLSEYLQSLNFRQLSHFGPASLLVCLRPFAYRADKISRRR